MVVRHSVSREQAHSHYRLPVLGCELGVIRLLRTPSPRLDRGKPQRTVNSWTKRRLITPLWPPEVAAGESRSGGYME
jgi:hypothetical protein